MSTFTKDEIRQFEQALPVTPREMTAVVTAALSLGTSESHPPQKNAAIVKTGLDDGRWVWAAKVDGVLSAGWYGGDSE